VLDRAIREVIADLKSYLEYLKGMGLESLPVSEQMPGEHRGNPSSLAGVGPTMKDIRNELGDCQRCKLHQTRRTIVFGEGNENAKLMFIGEGPGYDEDVQGRPFVGKAGQLLTRIIQSMHLQREEVYIANIIKCRPPQNRNPEPDEIESCSPFVRKQIDAIRPRVVCALGTFSAQTLLKTKAGITALRGKIYTLDNITVIPTYHPAFLLRNPEKKKDVWEDMKRVLERLREEEKSR
jgi:uracil-DNA glycosylase family 4